VFENGDHCRILALEDATIVHLGIPITGELGPRLRALLGNLLDAHADPRGVPVYPTSYTLAAKTWDAAVEELGEAAEWVRLENPRAAMADMLGAFGLGAGEIADIERAVASGDRDQLFSSALRMAQEMADRGDFAELAQRMNEQDLGNALDPSQLQGMGVDLEALTREAQRMLQQNPELEAQIRAAFGAPEDDENGDDE
jgi:hypothetical protein